MKTCPDCRYIAPQIAGDDRFLVIDIGETPAKLKEFLKLRDDNPVFKEVKEEGLIGIPCFVKEDGSVSLTPEEVGLKPRPENFATNACSLNGSGC